MSSSWKRKPSAAHDGTPRAGKERDAPPARWTGLNPPCGDADKPTERGEDGANVNEVEMQVCL